MKIDAPTKRIFLSTWDASLVVPYNNILQDCGIEITAIIFDGVRIKEPM